MNDSAKISLNFDLVGFVVSLTIVIVVAGLATVAGIVLQFIIDWMLPG